MAQIVVNPPRWMLGVALCWAPTIASAQLGCESGPSASPAAGKPASARPAAAGVAATSKQADTAAAGASAPRPKKPSAEGKGPVAKGEGFALWLQASSPLAAGKPGAVEWVLEAKPPYHCNEEYPHKLKLDAPPPGVSYPESLVRGMVVKGERAVLSVPVQPQAKGLARISGTAHFSVCTEARCLIEKHPVSVDVLVN